jgi:hypothetical protein
MARPEFRRFNDLAFLQAIDKPKYLRRLLGPFAPYFTRNGVEISTLDNSPETDKALLAVFTRAQEPIPGMLAEALYAIDELADEAGHDRFLTEAEALGVKLPTDDDLTPGELAILVYLEHGPVFRRAQDRTLFLKVKNYEEFQGMTDRVLRVPSQAKVRALESFFGEWFKEHLRGAVCEIDAYREGDEVKFAVSHGRPYRSEGTYEQDQRSRVTYRPQKHDSVIYDNRTHTLKVNAQTQGEKDLYRRKFGEVLFEDADHFPTGERYTLKPLIEKGFAALTYKSVPGIAAVRCTEVWIAHLDGESWVEKHRSVDLAATQKRHGRPVLTDGRLVRAGIMLSYSSGGRARKLEIRPTNVAIYDRQRDPGPTERFLDLNGFRLDSRPGQEGEVGPDEVLG